MLELLPRFLPQFLSGLLVNFEIAICALLGGMLLGAPLAAARFHNGRRPPGWWRCCGPCRPLS
jgi:ABC-type amino acid transport system permease subunit